MTPDCRDYCSKMRHLYFFCYCKFVISVQNPQFYYETVQSCKLIRTLILQHKSICNHLLKRESQNIIYLYIGKSLLLYS
jgi:hypothetical protein